MLHFACSVGWFPLTLTLSLREREQRAADSWLADCCWPNAGLGVIERLWIILPLPTGEGRGEGESRVAISRSYQYDQGAMPGAGATKAK